jgi:hypothetical protein
MISNVKLNFIEITIYLLMFLISSQFEYDYTLLCTGGQISQRVFAKKFQRYWAFLAILALSEIWGQK